MSATALFQDVFEVLERDPDGKFFDKGEYANCCTSQPFLHSWHLAAAEVLLELSTLTM